VFENCPLTSITIPNSVLNIESEGLAGCTTLTEVTIGNSVTNIGDYAFLNCYNLNEVYFTGDSPIAGSWMFLEANLATVYYLPGTAGWGPTFGSGFDTAPTALWNPQAQTGDGSFGVFGFNITGSSNLVIVVEAATNLTDPAWVPVGTNTLNTFVGTNGTSYFSDPQWANYPNRFYRFRSP
jgi:BspA type Leucine rich repeat region (6 copies)